MAFVKMLDGDDDVYEKDAEC